MSYNQPSISGNWYVYHIPKDYTYRVGVSVCKDWFIHCETRYYENPQCFQLAYVPDFYERHPVELQDGCELVDMRAITEWDRIFISLELKQGKTD